jgi:SAM-dependent methyltransferase
LRNSSCLLCAARTFAPRLLVCPDLYLRTPFLVDYGACTTCGLVQQAPAPASTAAFYPTSYPMHHSRGGLFKFARKMLIRGCYYAPSAGDAGKVLLDFGCGDGSYLESIAGQVKSRIGFEAAPGQARQVGAQLDIPVTCDLADSATVPDASVDILTAHFVLEHLTDLHAAFAFWQRVLKRGGRLHVAIPNIDCFEARLFGKKWHGLDAPRHISFPSAGNLARLARMHGFKIVRRKWGIFPNTWAASLATALAGHYNHKLFLLMMPLGVLLAWLMPQSTAVYTLVKK